MSSRSRELATTKSAATFLSLNRPRAFRARGRRSLLLRLTAGDPQEDFFQAQLIFAETHQPGAALDKRLGHDAVIGIMADESDLDLAIQSLSLANFRPGLEQLDCLRLIGVYFDPTD